MLLQSNLSHSTWELRTKLCLSLPSRSTHTRKKRLCFASPHPGQTRAGCKESWGRIHSEPVLQRGEWDRNPGAAQAKPILSTGPFQQQSCHPCFCLVDYEFPFLLQKLFFHKPSREVVHSQQSHLLLAQLIHLG